MFNSYKLSIIVLFFFTFAKDSGAQQKLIHYWHFNNFTFVGVNGNPNLIAPVKADYSALDTNKAFIAYRAIPGTSNNYLSYWDFVNPGDTVNTRMGFAAGNGLRPRNPWDSMQLMCFIPTLNYQNITIKYGTQRSGSGPALQVFDYSLDSGLTYINTGLSQTSFVVTSTTNPMNLVSISISNPAVANQKNFLFRIRIAQGTGGTAGNNRFDNITVEGDTLIAPSGPPFYAINQVAHTNLTTGLADSNGVKCVVRGVVYGQNQRATGVQFLIRDNTGGITVFSTSLNYYNVTEGDSVQVQGTLSAFRGLTEMSPLDTIIKLGSGKNLKAPTIATALNEQNESDLIKVSNLMFYTTPSGTNWPTVATNYLCHTQGFNDTITLRVLPTFAVAGTLLPSSVLFSVTGITTQFSSSTVAPFAFNGYQLIPRYNSDIVAGLAPPDSVTSIINSNPTLSSLTFSWTKPATYSNATMTTLVFIKQGSAINSGTPGLNPANYTANTSFTGNGTAFQNDALAKCVMNSDSNLVTVTGLNQNTNYYVLIYNVRNSDSVYSKGATATAITSNNIPQPVTSLLVKGVSTTSINISWVKPSVYDNTSHTTLVFVKEATDITPGTPSSAPGYYTANTALGSGTAYQNDASAFCVFNNDTNTITITNLKVNTKYYVLVWVVRNSDGLYATSSTSANGLTLPPPPTIKLIHFWNFNTFPTYAPPTGTSANIFRFLGVPVDYTTLDSSKAKLYYRSMDGVSNMYATYWDAVTGDTVNQRLNVTGGTAFRARNPSDSMQLMLYIPTTHYKNIVLSYACQKSSIASGAYQQNYSYSTDAGKTWKTTGLSKTLDSTAGVNYTKMQIIFTNADTMAYNNPNLIFKIRFAIGPNGVGDPAGLSGNNRFDNIAVEGDTTTATPITEIKSGISKMLNDESYLIYPNPGHGQFTIQTPAEGLKLVTIIDAKGQKVYEAEHTEMNIKLELNSLSKGIYFINILQKEAVSIKSYKVIIQ